MKKENSLILNITINKVNKYEIDNLTPNTTYEISLAAGNQNGFGEVIITSFLTSKDGEYIKISIGFKLECRIERALFTTVC